MTLLSTAPKLMAHLPLLVADDAKEMLVIAFGMGTTTRLLSFTRPSVTAVDIVPETFETFRYYHRDVNSILASLRAHCRERREKLSSAFTRAVRRVPRGNLRHPSGAPARSISTVASSSKEPGSTDATGDGGAVEKKNTARGMAWKATFLWCPGSAVDHGRR